MKYICTIIIIAVLFSSTIQSQEIVEIEDGHFLDTTIVQNDYKVKTKIYLPNIDDKLFHFGFQLGINSNLLKITESQVPVNMRDTMDILHVSGNTPMPCGMHVGFIFDVRLCKYVNLRLTPGLQFSYNTLHYTANSGREVYSKFNMYNMPKYRSNIPIVYMPFYIPLSLKFSTPRFGNLRPYILAGGGVSFNVNPYEKSYVGLKLLDYFCEAGFGCDIYFRWFKWCPEITYRIGFANLLSPADKHKQIFPENEFYTDAISQLQSHCISLTFNFQN